MGGPPQTKNKNKFQKKLLKKRKNWPNLAVLAPETDSSEDLVACGPKVVQKYALAATFWPNQNFQFFKFCPPPKKNHWRAQNKENPTKTVITAPPPRQSPQGAPGS